MSRIRPNHELALDMWKAGKPSSEISAACGFDTDQAAISAISRARIAGDPRAVRRIGIFSRGMSTNMRKDRGQTPEQLAARMASRERDKRARKFPCSDRDLAAVAASYVGPVTICPPGAHIGWVPEWIRKI